MTGEFSAQAVRFEEYSAAVFEHLPEAYVCVKRASRPSKTSPAEGMRGWRYVDHHAVSSIVVVLPKITGLSAHSLGMSPPEASGLKIPSEIIRSCSQPFIDAGRAMIEFAQEKLRFHHVTHGIMCHRMEARKGNLKRELEIPPYPPDQRSKASESSTLLIY